MLQEKRQLLSLFLIFWTLVAMVPLPIVSAQSSWPKIVGLGFVSRTPITNKIIDPHMFFDGANYIYVTNFGNYSWIQPLNILRFVALDGSELISKSIFVLQENSTGTWLSLLNFANLNVKVANDSHYILHYEILKKSKGKNYVVGNVEIVFDLIHSLSLPKISVSLTKNGNWTLLGLNYFRWIWDLVPSSSYRYYVNEETKQNVELSGTDLIDIGITSRVYLDNQAVFDEKRNWVKVDYDDVGVYCKTQGGKEPYWNSRGVVVVFPTNQANIDPSTIVTGYSASSTRIEQQRKVFRNPRGQKYYYSLIEYGDRNWRFYKSSDGSTWEQSTNLESSLTSNPSVWIWEDSTNSRLLIYVAYLEYWSTGWRYVSVRCFKIDDDSSIPSLLWDSHQIAERTDDAIHNPAICLAGNGYLWVVWADEYTAGGKARIKFYAKVTTTTYPTSEPSWTGSTLIIDPGKKMNTSPGKIDVCSLTATANVAIAYTYYDLDGSTQHLRGKTGSYAGSGSPTFGTEVTFSTPSSDMMHSIVADTTTDSDVYVLLESSTPALICEKWDVSASTKSSYGTVFSGNVDSLALSIDKTASPDKLYAFYAKNGVAGDLFYKDTTNGTWSGETTIDDNTESLKYLSASYQDWNGDGKVQIIYTRQTSYEVRFYELVTGQQYTADLSQSLTSSFQYATVWNALSGLSQAIVTNWIFSSQWNALVDISESITTSWGFVCGMQYIIGLSQALSTSLEATIQWNALASLSQTITNSLGFAIAWTASAGLTQDLVTSWQILTQWNALADLNQNIITSWLASINQNFAIELAQTITTALQSIINWNSLVDLTQNFSTIWEASVKWDALSTLIQEIATSWEAVTQWNALADLSQAISATFEVAINQGFAVSLSQAISTAWEVAVELITGGHFYTVDLSQAITTSWQITIKWEALIGLNQAISISSEAITNKLMPGGIYWPAVILLGITMGLLLYLVLQRRQ